MSTARLYYLDWLRVGAFCLLVVFHVGFVYGPEKWLVTSAHSGAWIEPWLLTLTPWRMSLVFFVSGVASGILVRKLSRAGFVRDRFARLMVPFAFAMVFIVPLQELLALRTSGSAPVEWVKFLVLNAVPIDFSTGMIRYPNVSHTWFLPFIFVYSVALAVGAASLRRLRSMLGDGREWSTQLMVAILLATGVLLAVCAGWLEPRFPRTFKLHTDFTAHVRWLPIFALGVLVAKRPSFWDWLAVHRWALTACSAVGLMSMLAVRDHFGRVGLLENTPAVETVGLLQGAYASATMFALMGHARHSLRIGTAALSYLNKAIMPLYLFHELAIVSAMPLLAAMRLPWILESSGLLVAAFLGPILLYEGLIKRVRILRVVCSVKVDVTRQPASIA